MGHLNGVVGAVALTTSEHDRFRKTAALRDLEARVREGEEPAHDDVARIVRRALEETPFEDLPLSKPLVDYIVSLPDRPVRRGRGRPAKTVANRREQMDGVLRLVVEVEAERRQLAAAGEGSPWEKAVDRVANLHGRTPDSLRKLIKTPAGRGVAWRFEKLAVQKSGIAPRQFDFADDGWPLDPTHPWNNGGN